MSAYYSDYFLICLWYYEGKLVHPTSFDDLRPFLHRMWAHGVDVSDQAVLL